MITTTITEHQKMVRSLTKPPDMIFASLDPKKCNLLHASNGLNDEFFELQIAIEKRDKENQLEELGDLLFYSECLVIDYEEELGKPKLVYLSINETMQLLSQVVKRHVFYEQELDLKNLIIVYMNLKSWIQFYASHIAKTMKDVENHNMEKLAVRYKNFQYNDEAAKARKDKA